MKLSEIVFKSPIVEDAEQAAPAELKDIVAGFPTKAKQAIRALWGKDRLEYRGMKFFSGGEFGKAYDKANDAIEAFVKAGFKIEVSIPVKDSSRVEAIDPDSGFDAFEYEAEVADSQEVYLGYKKDEDKLYLGVDAWLEEESFNENWDKEFKRQFGTRFEYDEDSHQMLFNDIWSQYSKMGFIGVLFELTWNASQDEFHVEDVQVSEPGKGFYQGIYNTSTFKSLNLVDMRLD